MSKVLQRSMFQKPQHEHRSTGIASGLEYREEYAVGGRVGFQAGGGDFSQKIAEFNRQQIEAMQQMEIPQFDPINVKTGLPSIDIPGLVGSDVTYPLSGGMATMGLNDAMAAASPENQPTTLDLMTPSAQTRPKGMTEAEARAFTSAMGPKEDPDSKELPKTENKEDKVEGAINAVFRADAFAKERRASLNEELAALRAKQDKDNKLVAALNIVSAMNDPNLPQGASRVGAGVQQLTAEAQNALAIKQQRDETDLARKFDIAENDIQRAYAREDYRTQKQIDAEFGEEGTQVKYMNYLLGQMGIESGSDQARDFIKEFVFGKKGQRGTLANTVFEAAGDIQTDPGDFRRLYGIPERLDEDGNDLPLDNQDVEAAMEYLDDTVLAGVDFKDGGRVGFSTGGSTTPELKNVPIVIGYDQLKKTLGEIVPDNVIKLISSNPTAFKEFAAIETNQDVENFNNEYDVRFSLPEPAKTEEEVVNVASSPSLNVTAPSAVMANPNIMPMQTGAGQLTPTETAFLSPTEQAIKMRS